MARAPGGQIKRKKGEAGAAKNYIVSFSVQDGHVDRCEIADCIDTSSFWASTDAHAGSQEAAMQHQRLQAALHPQG
jgi:hypothetical protein